MIVTTSFQIAKVKGIPIRLHFTLLVTFVLISWTVAVRFTPNIYPGLSSIEYWTVGILGAIVLFLSVTLHELSHSVMAMRYGLHVREIILFIFGEAPNIPFWKLYITNALLFYTESGLRIRHQPILL